MNKIIPVGDRLIVSPNTEDVQKTEGGVLAVDETLDRAIVVAVSDSLKELYKAGDTILYPKTSALGVIYDGKPCAWVEASSVWGIVTE